MVLQCALVPPPIGRVLLLRLVVVRSAVRTAITSSIEILLRIHGVAKAGIATGAASSAKLVLLSTRELVLLTIIAGTEASGEPG